MLCVEQELELEVEVEDDDMENEYSVEIMIIYYRGESFVVGGLRKRKKKKVFNVWIVIQNVVLEGIYNKEIGELIEYFIRYFEVKFLMIENVEVGVFEGGVLLSKGSVSEIMFFFSVFCLQFELFED